MATAAVVGASARCSGGGGSCAAAADELQRPAPMEVEMNVNKVATSDENVDEPQAKAYGCSRPHIVFSSSMHAPSATKNDSQCSKGMPNTFGFEIAGVAPITLLDLRLQGLRP